MCILCVWPEKAIKVHIIYTLLLLQPLPLLKLKPFISKEITANTG